MSLINRHCGTSVGACSGTTGRWQGKWNRESSTICWGEKRILWADTRGVVSESAGYRTWSIKLLIVPKSLVTIATIIHWTSSIILHTETPVMYSIHFLASSSSTSFVFSFWITPRFRSIKKVIRWTRDWDDSDIINRLFFINCCQLLAEAVTTSTSTSVTAISWRGPCISHD